MDAVDPRRSTQLLQPAVERLNPAIGRLDDQQWRSPSSCAGWSVAELVSHVVVNGYMVLTFAQRALAGDPTPAFGPAAREVREQIQAAGPKAAAERQTQEADALRQLAAGLDEADLAKIGVHPLGPRSVSWIITSRLAEVEFHHWDLRRSLGEAGAIDAAVARHLLPYLLHPDYLGLFRRQVPAEAPLETFRFRSAADGATWRVAMAHDQAEVTTDPAAAATVEVTAEPRWLALAIYGRARISAAPFRIRGPQDAADLFARYFGAPSG